MYYIWRTDVTGWLLLDALMAAADRGVRVRLLLEDVNVQGFDPAFLALTGHPMTEVRLFNPTRNRGHVVRRTFEMLLGLARFNRRLHGKLWIADGRLAIIGGRNIGDTYFGALEGGSRNSVDADMLLVGPMVDKVAALFDSYWNLGLALPILALWPGFKMNRTKFCSRLACEVRTPPSRRYLAGTLNGRRAEAVLKRFGFHATHPPPISPRRRPGSRWLSSKHRGPGLRRGEIGRGGERFTSKANRFKGALLVIHDELKSIIEDFTEDNAEDSYRKFYVLSQEVLRTEEDGVETIVRIRQHLCASDSPVFRSYGLLFLGAAVDAIAKMSSSNSEVTGLGQFLISEVSSLADFRNFDERDHYIHFVSHLAYLGLALSDAGVLSKSEAATLAREICAMYGLSKSAYFLNEPFVVGELILMLCKGQPEVLKSAFEAFQLENAEQELGLVQGAILRANYDYLCMAISLMNAKYEIAPDVPIQTYVDNLLDRIHG